MAQINKSNWIKVIIENPWKKITIVGALIVALIIVTEIVGNYMGAYLEKIKNSYFIYPILIIGVLIIIISIFVFIRRYKSKQVITKNMKAPIDIRDEDIKRVLKRVDELLEKLPQEEIDKFTGTKDAGLYKALLKKYGM